MNVFDFVAWRATNVTDTYHFWQLQVSVLYCITCCTDIGLYMVLCTQYCAGCYTDSTLLRAVLCLCSVGALQNSDHVLWKLGTLPVGLLTFYGLSSADRKGVAQLRVGVQQETERVSPRRRQPVLR